MLHSPISVLLVDDSIVVLTILSQLLCSSPEIKVVGTARNGKEALALIPQLQPAVICTDLYMREMDGLELIKQVMAKYPRPILAISAAVQPADTQNIFRLLEAGAVDVFPKPMTGLAADYQQIKQELIGKIKILAGVKVFTRRQPEAVKTSALLTGVATAKSTLQSVTSSRIVEPNTTIRAIAIGASTGGPQALFTILTQLPASLPVPVICVQHICEGFLTGLIDWLTAKCDIKVQIALANTKPSPGIVYFAPDQHHLELDAQGRFSYSLSPAIDGHRPSVTVTFKSVAKFYGRAAAGVLLTGMGRDGADGMQAIAAAGGVTIAQSENSCVVFGMPKEAIALKVVQQVLSPEEIAASLLTKLLH